MVVVDGMHAVVRTTQVPHPDPGWVALQVEGWESDPTGDVAEGATEAPVYYHNIPIGMIADGQVDVTAAIAHAESVQAGQVRNLVRARAALASIPQATRRPA